MSESEQREDGGARYISRDPQKLVVASTFRWDTGVCVSGSRQQSAKSIRMLFSYWGQTHSCKNSLLQNDSGWQRYEAHLTSTSATFAMVGQQLV